MRSFPRTLGLPWVALLGAVAACGDGEPAPPSPPPPDPDPSIACVPVITLPEGLCAVVHHPGVGRARQLVVAGNGDVFVGMRSGGVVALRDEDGDHKADRTERWGEPNASGIGLGEETLYLAVDNGVLRYPLAEGSLVPSGEPDVIVTGLPDERNHAAKSLALHPDGTLFVGIGSPGNACQDPARTPGLPGKDPCEELATRGGIWRFAADQTGQSQQDGERFSTGVRNAAAIAVHPGTGDLYATIHGRDQLRELWPSYYTAAEGSENPAEEFARIDLGSDFGWPYCYHNPATNQKLLAPEYGGDGSTVGRCADMDMPDVVLPAHWAPNAMAFSHAGAPEGYREGAFVAFHGSWNRSPPQQGYNVTWIPFENGEPTGGWSVFADGFAGGTISSSGQADYRPTGVAVGPGGAVYISDSLSGRIWKVIEKPDQ